MAFSHFHDNVVNNLGLVYETTKFEEKYSKYNLKYEEFQALNKDAEYEVVYERIQNTDWKLCLYKPHATIVSDTRPIRLLIIFVIMVSVITLFIGMVWIGRVITDRLLYLKRGMIAAEEGDFSFRLEDNSKDEIGELIRGYNTLLTKMEILIKEVYESEIAQKKYEMKALQNQINPHFLYNTLSLINWKAIENGNKDISEITLALSHFYRTSLNKGRNVLPIADEIKNVKSYIAVQLFMHDYDFDVEYQIDESIMKYESLNLILQPIVENAIEHGLDVMEGDVRGKIFIKGWLENNKIYLSVEDNGVGMNEEKTKNIITQKSNGYGMCNVNERIHLYYGDEYGIKVESKINKGTIVTICIPADCTLCLEK